MQNVWNIPFENLCDIKIIGLIVQLPRAGQGGGNVLYSFIIEAWNRTVCVDNPD